MATAVSIRDAWSGRDPNSPFPATIQLRRDKSGVLSGIAYTFKGSIVNRIESVSLDREASSALLLLLANAHLRPGNEPPGADHTREFPPVEIAIEMDTRDEFERNVLLYATSQKDGRGSWAAYVRGDLYVVTGDELDRGIRVIRALVQGEPSAAEIEAHARLLVSRLDAKYRPTRKPGEVMSREEAEEWGGPEFGGMIYRLANSSEPDVAKKPARSRSPSRSKRS